jgi:hypothetical protein
MLSTVRRALLPRLGSAVDSTWAQLRLTEAHALSGNTTAACTALDGARATARTAAQREAVTKYDGQLGCR